MTFSLLGASLFTALIVAVGCSGDQADVIDPDPGADAPTWHKDIAPIVAEHCQGCHSPGNIGPFDLLDHNDAEPLSMWMAQVVESGEMPPWGAGETDDCAPTQPWQDDQSLTDDEIARIRAWADAGAPEGDPQAATPLPAPPSRTLDDATHQVTVTEPYVTAGFKDEFRCFVLDPNLSQDQWLTGIEVVPGNFAVVHHATITLDEDGESAALAGPDGGYECFGSVGVDGPIVGGYTPGAPPFLMPQGTGLPIPSGSLLVLQIHYHPLGDPADPDATTVKLRLTDEAPPQTAAFTFFGNAGRAPTLQPGPNDRGGVEFYVPAGAEQHTETMRFPIETGDIRAPIWSMYPHMHYVGVDMEIRIERANPPPGEPSEECLAKISRYNFDWQRLYSYDAPLAELPTVGSGDTLVIQCTYDNTMSNPNVARGLLEQGLDAPVDVFLGEDTLDEMCTSLFGYVVP